MRKLTIAEAILLRDYRFEAEDAPIVFSVDGFNTERGPCSLVLRRSAGIEHLLELKSTSLNIRSANWL